MICIRCTLSDEMKEKGDEHYHLSCLCFRVWVNKMLKSNQFDCKQICTIHRLIMNELSATGIRFANNLFSISLHMFVVCAKMFANRILSAVCKEAFTNIRSSAALVTAYQFCHHCTCYHGVTLKYLCELGFWWGIMRTYCVRMRLVNQYQIFSKLKIFIELNLEFSDRLDNECAWYRVKIIRTVCTVLTLTKKFVTWKGNKWKPDHNVQ